MRHMIQQGVPPGIFHGLRNDFDSDHPAAGAADGQGDRSGAAVQIAERIRRGKSGKGGGRFIEFVRLLRIDLEKGSRTQLKPDAENDILYGFTSIYMMETVGKDHIVPGPVFIDPQAGDAQLRKRGNQGIQVY